MEFFSELSHTSRKIKQKMGNCFLKGDFFEILQKGTQNCFPMLEEISTKMCVFFCKTQMTYIYAFR